MKKKLYINGTRVAHLCMRRSRYPLIYRTRPLAVGVA